MTIILALAEHDEDEGNYTGATGDSVFTDPRNYMKLPHLTSSMF